MDRPSSSSSAPAPAAVPILLTRGPPTSTGQAPAASEKANLTEITLLLIEDHDRMAQGLNDVVIRRLFAAGLDLHTALELVGDHRGAGQIQHAIRELDLAIRDIRDAIFDHGAPAVVYPDQNDERPSALATAALARGWTNPRRRPTAGNRHIPARHQGPYAWAAGGGRLPPAPRAEEVGGLRASPPFRRGPSSF